MNRERIAAAACAVLASAAACGAALAVTPPQAKPVVTATWRGMERDVVGRLKQGTPNGERDGHFTATLSNAGGRVVTAILVQRVFRQGGYAEGWDTNPGTSASILGVVAGGRRLNPTDRDVTFSVSSNARRTYELYANELGTFAPGQLFKVWFGFKDGTAVSSPAVTLPGRPATLAATFQGLGTDVVGAGTDQKANGQPDAHFQLRLATNGAWRVLVNVIARHLTPTGALDLPIYWMGGPNTAGLVIEGTRYLWPTAMPEWGSVYVPLPARPGVYTLDVYANDPTPPGGTSLFRPGEKWRLTVEFSDTRGLGIVPPSVDVTT